MTQQMLGVTVQAWLPGFIWLLDSMMGGENWYLRVVVSLPYTRLSTHVYVHTSMYTHTLYRYAYVQYYNK